MNSYLKPPFELRNGYKDKKRLANLHNLPCANCYLKNRKQITPTIAHYKIGLGLGLKASDNLTMSLCTDCHTGNGGIHNVPLKKWEADNNTQDYLIEITNLLLKS